MIEVSGLGNKTVASWSKRPGCPRKRNGRGWLYAWPDWNEWRTAERIAEAVKKAKPANLDEARARKLAAEAEKAEMELAQARGQLVTVEDFRAHVGKMGDRVRAAVLAVPGKWAPRLEGVTEVADFQAALRAAMAEVLEELSSDG